MCDFELPCFEIQIQSDAWKWLFVAFYTELGGENLALNHRAGKLLSPADKAANSGAGRPLLQLPA